MALLSPNTQEKQLKEKRIVLAYDFKGSSLSTLVAGGGGGVAFQSKAVHIMEARKQRKEDTRRG